MVGLSLLSGFVSVTVVVALGKFAFDAYLQTRAEAGLPVPTPRPVFGHGRTSNLGGGVTLISSYHPSRQNTNTGKLTTDMFDAIFSLARDIARKVEADLVFPGQIKVTVIRETRSVEFAR